MTKPETQPCRQGLVWSGRPLRLVARASDWERVAWNGVEVAGLALEHRRFRGGSHRREGSSQSVTMVRAAPPPWAAPKRTRFPPPRGATTPEERMYRP